MKNYFIVFFLGFITSCQKTDQRLVVDEINNVSKQELLNDMVSSEDAKKAALEILNGSSSQVNNALSASIKRKNFNNGISTSIKEVLQHKSENHKSLIYIVKYEGGGFCILSGNKRSIPVLAYSEHGTISESDISQNLGLKMWAEQSLSYIQQNSNNLSDTLIVDNRSLWKGLLEGNSLLSNIQSRNDPDYNQRIGLRHKRMQEIWDQSNGQSQLMPLSAAGNSIPQETLNEFKMIANRNNCPEEYTIVEVVNERTQFNKGPLIQTNWSQGGVFGALVPNSLAGCTAVAAGQIMNYYRYPTQFNWNNMTDARLDVYQDISLFMKDLGTAFNMSYYSDVSGATNSAVRNGMSSYGYHVQEKKHNNQDVYKSISQQKPVYVTGCRNKIVFPGIGINCHAWVVDGVDYVQTTTYYRIEWQNSSYEYETNNMQYNFHGSGRQLYHVNWGWGSSLNGWFIDLHNAPVADRNYKYSQENLYFTKP